MCYFVAVGGSRYSFRESNYTHAIELTKLMLCLKVLYLTGRHHFLVWDISRKLSFGKNQSTRILFLILYLFRHLEWSHVLYLKHSPNFKLLNNFIFHLYTWIRSVRSWWVMVLFQTDPILPGNMTKINYYEKTLFVFDPHFGYADWLCLVPQFMQ